MTSFPNQFNPCNPSPVKQLTAHIRIYHTDDWSRTPIPIHEVASGFCAFVSLTVHYPSSIRLIGSITEHTHWKNSNIKLPVWALSAQLDAAICDLNRSRPQHWASLFSQHFHSFFHFFVFKSRTGLLSHDGSTSSYDVLQYYSTNIALEAIDRPLSIDYQLSINRTRASWAVESVVMYEVSRLGRGMLTVLSDLRKVAGIKIIRWDSWETDSKDEGRLSNTQSWSRGNLIHLRQMI